jgi:dihydrolipoamide dehydrogenase
VLLKSKVEEISEYAADHVVARLSDGSEIRAEKVLVSVGRKPNSAGVGLETVGVETDPRGYVVVDDYLETNVPGIFAIGVVNGGQMLAHVASYEALVAVDNCLATAPRDGGRATCAPRRRAPTRTLRWQAWAQRGAGGGERLRAG